MVNNSDVNRMKIFHGRFMYFLLLMVLPVEVFSQNADIEILRSINSPEALPADNFYKFVTNSAIYVSIGTPITMGATGLIKHDKKLLRNAEVIAGAFVVSTGITIILKYSVNRDRPFVTYPDITQKASAGSPSFPSGHTSAAFSTATSLSLEYPKWYVIVPSFGWAGLVGYSRMYLGVHYPSDVLAGAAIGAGSAWLTHFVNKKLELKNQKKKPQGTR
jgi:membrane-associated phospholipid phosphatase